jgi:uroporphyrinogen-III decarboxylase
MKRRERIEAALAHEEVDRLPFWVKIFGRSYKQLQPPKWRDMDAIELADYLELDHYGASPAPVRTRNPKVTESVEETDTRRTQTWETPDGRLQLVYAFDSGSCSWHPIEFPIRSVEDIRAARHIFQTRRFEQDEDLLERATEACEAVGDRGICFMSMHKSPLMNLIEHLIGPVHAYYLLQDYPDEMDELIGIMQAERLRFLEAAVPVTPADWVVTIENTSTTLLSPAVFRKYCKQHLSEYSELIHAHDKKHIMHMCGTLKNLLPDIEEIGAEVIEAYSAPPIGDTTIADRNELCPSIAVIGGTCANTWLKPVSEICAEIERALHEAGGMRGVFMTSAGVMPPACGIEKIKKVREHVKALTPQRLGC